MTKLANEDILRGNSGQAKGGKPELDVKRQYHMTREYVLVMRRDGGRDEVIELATRISYVTLAMGWVGSYAEACSRGIGSSGSGSGE